MTSIKNDIRLCPFFGSVSTVETWIARKGFCGAINCSNCPSNMFSITFDTEEEVIDWLIRKWNRRDCVESA